MCTESVRYRGVTPVTDVIVRLDDTPWPFAEQNRDRVSAFWRAKQESHPHLYNGQVHVMTSWEIGDDKTRSGVFLGTLRRTNFASFLFWKEFETNAERDVDFSGGAAVLCSDGALLMAVSGEHTIVPGTLEFPSGFVEIADFDGIKLNFDRHVEREVIEEFAITSAQLGRQKQYLVSAVDGVVQVISIFILDTDGDEFTQRWRGRIGPSRSEISDVVAIYRSSDLAGFSVQAHVKAALSYLLTSGYSRRSQ